MVATVTSSIVVAVPGILESHLGLPNSFGNFHFSLDNSSNSTRLVWREKLSRDRPITVAIVVGFVNAFTVFFMKRESGWRRGMIDRREKRWLTRVL